MRVDGQTDPETDRLLLQYFAALMERSNDRDAVIAILHVQ